MGPDGVESYPNQSSGVLSSVCWADALALVPANTTIAQNDIVQVWPLKLL
jgi:molybdopterin molybdotransferase